jgi:hypothetical protein
MRGVFIPELFRLINNQSITVIERSKAWTLFTRSNTGIVGSNSTRGMDVLQTVYRIRKTKKAVKASQRAVVALTNEWIINAIGIVTGYGIDNQGARRSSSGRVKNFHFSISSRSALGSTQCPIQRAQGAVFLEVQKPGRETDHPAPTSAEVKKTWICTSAPPYAFMTYCLIKHRDNFTF